MPATKLARIELEDDEEVDEATELTPSADEAEDIDPADWLAEAGPRMGSWVSPEGKRMKIISLSDRDIEKIRRDSMRPVKGTRTMDVDGQVFRRELVATSLNRAHGRANPTDHRYIPADALRAMLPGYLERIATAVMKLSGYGEDADPEDFFG